MKRTTAVISLLCAMVMGAGSCSFLPSQSTSSTSSTSEQGSSAVELISTEIYKGDGAFALSQNQTKTLEINQDISGKEYIKIVLDNNVNLLGEYKYSDVSNPDTVVTEPFYIEPSSEEIEFKQFFDAFRPNAIGAFDKKLISITLKNLDEKIANVNVKSITVTNREVPAFEKEIYLEKGGLKVGADLAMGGTLSYLEKLGYNGETIDEVIDANDNVTIGVNAKEGAKEHLSSSVNLINICDAGREFQQSYYADIGGNMQEATGANGYERRWSFTATREGYYWPYNPVQGGDEVCNLSQIVDYEVTNDSIYVKVRAMDWGNGYARPEYANHKNHEEFKKGRTTKSYIENTYTIKGGMLYVDNRFIDWNGFTDLENIPVHTLEIPAAYVVHPLSNYVCYVGSNPWDLSDTNYEREPSLPGWWLGDETHVNFTHPEDWFAWVNDEDFGVAVYIPNAGAYISGRNNVGREIGHTHNSDALNSRMAGDYLYNKVGPTSAYTSCYVGNTSYTAPIVNVRMKEYVALSYSYVVAVDYLPVMRSAFKNIVGSITNKGLEAWN